MKVAYVLSGTDLSGGSKVVFEHVALLNNIPGFFACVVAPTAYPGWIGFSVPFLKGNLESVDLSSFDLIVTTFFDQGFLYRMWDKPFLHFCQGFEGDYTEDLGLEHLDESIKEFYRISYPKMVVSRFLVAKLKAFTDAPVFFVGQALGKGFVEKHPPAGHRNSILLVGQAEYPFKGVEMALKVASELKRLFPRLRVVRVSPSDTRREELSKFQVDEFWVRVPPSEMPRFYKRAILSIYLPKKEGFGLPVLESIALGTPVVASDIPPFREICGPSYPLCSSYEEAFELSLRLLTDKAFFSELVRRGVERSREFSRSKLLVRLIRAFVGAVMWGRA